MYPLNSWQGQGPPSQWMSIVLIADKLKWSVRRNSSPLSDRRLCVSLTNTMPQKKTMLDSPSPSWSPQTNLSAQTRIKDAATACLVMKPGMCHLLSSGLLIDANRYDSQRGEGSLEEHKNWKAAFRFY